MKSVVQWCGAAVPLGTVQHGGNNGAKKQLTVVRPRGLEPLASCSGGKRSIR